MMNKVKGDMYSWCCTHTYNTVKGACPHDCEYCHPAGTKIMMGDYTQKSIEEIQIGDEIIGIINAAEPKWVNIGANTNSKVKLPEPEPGKVKDLIEALKEFTAVEIKPNLKRLLCK